MKISFAICLTLTAGTGFAQLLEIRGTVIEAGTNRGLADVEIKVNFEAPADGRSREVGKITTDARGAFHFQPEEVGAYYFEPTKAGYAQEPDEDYEFPVGFGKAVAAYPDDKAPRPELRFILGRSGIVTGRIVDWDSGEPIANYDLQVASFFYQNGVPRWFPAPTIPTNRDGEFVSKALTPGKYLIVVSPPSLGKSRFEENPTEGDLKKIDEGYSSIVWPGGGELENAVPLSVVPGGSVDAGTIRLRNEPLYRVYISVSKTNCDPNQKVLLETFWFYDQYPVGESFSTSCGASLLVKGYANGRYGIFLTQGEAEHRMRSWTSFDVAGRNLDFVATLGRGVDIDGTLIRADDAERFPLENVHVGVEPTAGITFGEEHQPSPTDSKGKFWLVDRLWAGKLHVFLVPQRGAYCIKEMRYNGLPVKGDLTLDPNAPLQILEIVVDDRPATIRGVVLEEDHPVDRPIIAVTPWPIADDPLQEQPTVINGGADGSFRISGLAPGEYRAVAVANVDRALLDYPGVLPRLAERAEKLEVERGAQVNLSLKRVDPSR
jgi:hypothetical protein